MSELCGRCLHAKEAHEKHNGHFMYCASCMKLCDLEDYNTQHKPSGIIVQDKMRMQLK